MILDKIVCPVSKQKADATVGRLTVLFNVALMVGFAVTRQPLFMLAVAADCALRASFLGGYSPLKWLAAGVARLLRLQGKPVDLAPKAFAARLGLICALSAAGLEYAHLTTASLAVTGLFITLAALDAVCNFCVGCVIYTYLVLPLFDRS